MLIGNVGGQDRDLGTGGPALWGATVQSGDRKQRLSAGCYVFLEEPATSTTSHFLFLLWNIF